MSCVDISIHFLVWNGIHRYWFHPESVEPVSRDLEESEPKKLEREKNKYIGNDRLLPDQL